jgi:protein phosphatase
MSETPIPGPVLIAFAEQCDRGLVREENQDSVRHVRIPLGELLIVADGIGGYQGGGTASRMAVEGFCSHMASLPTDYPPDRAIKEASARANAEIVAAAKAPGSPFQHMGSTVVLALLQQRGSGTQAQTQVQTQAETNAWIGHIGDSRAYLVRSGRLSRLTNDHSAVQALLNRNLITPEQALHHPDASVLTRSLGHDSEVEIDIDPVELTADDTLLLCSDGLWGYVAEQQIEGIAADLALTVEAAVKALLESALAAGGHDNIGIELARLSLPPVATPPVPTRQRRHGFMEILAVCLIVFAGLGALVTFGVLHHWFHSLRPLH